MTQDMTPSKKLAMAALVAAIVGVIAFCLPMASVSAYGFSFERNGLDLCDAGDTGGTFMNLALVGSVVAVIFAALGLSKRVRLNIAAIGAAAGAGGALIAFIVQEVMDYADYGFWMFIIAEAACVALSLMGVNKAKTE